MAEARRGLGRGLSALLGEVEAPEIAAEGAPGARETPIELIRRNPAQPRRTFDESEIDELASSIREKGLLQPILVRPAPGAPGEFEIVAGERRWRAAQKAGLKALPVLVRELDDQQALEIAIVENVQRTDLNALEEALSYKALIDRFKRTQDAVAKAVGKSRSHVANSLRLLAMPEPVQQHLAAGRLTAGHARAIATAPDPVSLAEQVVSRGLSVRDTEALARKVQTASPQQQAAKGGRRKDADTRDLEENLSDVLGINVEIRDRGGAGEIRLHYDSLEQLDDLCRRLTRP